MRPAGELVQAVVQAGAEATPYLRCGRGECALVVAVDGAERLRLALLLGGHFRVVAPTPPVLPAGAARPEALAAWLRGVADGLGLEQPRLLLCPELAAEAASLRLDGEWLEVLELDEDAAAEPLLARLGVLG